MTDLIVAPTAIKVLYDLLEKLVQNRSTARKERFEKILKPLFDELITVNEDYYAMFLRSAQAVARLRSERASQERHDELDRIKQRFRDWRQKREGIRDKVRQDAAQFLFALDAIEERRFLLSILEYFLEDGPRLDDYRADAEISKILERGGLTVLRTPSSRLSLEIAEAREPEELKQRFETARISLNEHFVHVCSQYNRVRIAVYRQA